MSQRSQQSIEDYLRQSDTQERIWKKIQEARENVTVTISRAAGLFGFSESKLREWEKRGLLQTERSLLSQDGKGSTGHRQYSSTELDKLAIIRDLIDHGYLAGDIPSNVDKIWQKMGGGGIDTHFQERVGERSEGRHLPIDSRVEELNRQEFWRYFVSQVLHISLGFICEDIPDTLAGIIMPLEDRKLAGSMRSPEDLPGAGPSLIGWLGTNRSFSTFLDDAPTFEFPSDFRLEKLVHSSEQFPLGDKVADNVLVILQRKARPLSLAPELVETIRHILGLIYKRLDSWYPAFDYGMHDSLYQIYDLESASRVVGDLTFNSLLERVLEAGGRNGSEQDADRWAFATLFTPKDDSVPIQQQILVARARTRESPHSVGVTLIHPNQINSLSLKAFQSGQLISLASTVFNEGVTAVPPNVLDPLTLRLDELAKNVRSALAVPLMGEHGVSIGVLYVASELPDAFSLTDQRVLRIFGRLIEGLLLTSQSRSGLVRNLKDLVSNPSVVDPAFRFFNSESMLVTELENVLEDIRHQRFRKYQVSDELSILSVDIDNQSSIALKYGNRVARNLSQQVGLRIQEQLRLSNRFLESKLFHVFVDRYYLLSVGVPIEEVRNQALQLKMALREQQYRIALFSGNQRGATVRENMLDLPEITVHLGVSSFPLGKLAELIERFPASVAVVNTRSLIIGGVEVVLERGKAVGGDCVFSWDPLSRGYQRID